VERYAGTYWTVPNGKIIFPAQHDLISFGLVCIYCRRSLSHHVCVVRIPKHDDLMICLGSVRNVWSFLVVGWSLLVLGAVHSFELTGNDAHKASLAFFDFKLKGMVVVGNKVALPLCTRSWVQKRKVVVPRHIRHLRTSRYMYLSLVYRYDWLQKLCRTQSSPLGTYNVEHTS
jgi:hypothetical protein